MGKLPHPHPFPGFTAKAVFHIVVRVLVGDKLGIGFLECTLIIGVNPGTIPRQETVVGRQFVQCIPQYLGPAWAVIGVFVQWHGVVEDARTG